MKRILILVILSITACGERKPKEPMEPIVLGERIYKSRCMQCHQWDGKGLLHERRYAADFTDPNGVLTRTDEDLTQSILNGVVSENGRMPAFKPILTQEDITGVLLYIRSTYGKEP